MAGLMSSFKKLMELSKLPKGWNYGSGEAPSARIVRLAAISLHHLYTIGAVKVDVLPSADGGITVMASYGDMFAEISVCEIGKFELVIERGETEIVDKSEMDFGELVNALENAGWQSPKSSGSHTHVFSVESMDASPAKRFVYMAKARQSFALPVSGRQAGLFAPILPGTTVASEASHPFLSGTKQRNLVLAHG